MSVDPRVVQRDAGSGPPALELIVTGRAADPRSRAARRPPRAAPVAEASYGSLPASRREEIVAQAIAIAEAELHAAVVALSERLSAADVDTEDGADRAVDDADAVHRRVSATLRAIIDSNTGSDEASGRGAAAAGIDLTVPHAVIAFTPVGECSSSPVAQRLDLATRLFLRGAPGAIVLPLAADGVPHAAFVVPAPAPIARRRPDGSGPASAATSSALLHSADVAERVARMHRLCAVVTEPATGVAGLRNRERTASILVALVHRESDAPGLVRERDRLLDVLLGSVSTDAGDTFVRSVLGPVLALSPARSEPLLETLGELLGARGGFAAAAQRLRVHRETVKYRMGRLTELTGYSIADPVQRTHLDVALRLGRIARR
jgi:PucR-like helix-turn-helix protein